MTTDSKQIWYAVSIDGYPHHIAFAHKASADDFAKRAANEDAMSVTVDEIVVLINKNIITK